MPEVLTQTVTTTVNDIVDVSPYDVTFHTPAGWVVGARPDGLYDVWGPAGALRGNGLSIPYKPAMDVDPRDCLGSIPV